MNAIVIRGSVSETNGHTCADPRGDVAGAAIGRGGEIGVWDEMGFGGNAGRSSWRDCGSDKGWEGAERVEGGEGRGCGTGRGLEDLGLA